MYLRPKRRRLRYCFRDGCSTRQDAAKLLRTATAIGGGATVGSAPAVSRFADVIVLAKALVAELLGDLDVDAIDVGPLSSGRFIEPAMMMLMRIPHAAQDSNE